MNTLKYIIKSFLQAQKAAQLQTVIKNTVEVNSLQHLQELFNWKIKPELSAYSHLYDVENFTDVNARRLRDAEVIAAVCANTNPEVVLEIGTSAGQTTAIMSQHAPRSQVYTVNIHPDEIAQGGELVTYAPSLDHIGKVYRQLGCKNVNQIIFWVYPRHCSCKTSVSKTTFRIF